MKKILLSLALLTSVFAAKAQVTYCTPTYGNPVSSCSQYAIDIQSLNIAGFAGSINDNMPCNGSGYLDQTAMSFTIQAGISYPVIFGTGPNYSSGAQMWIDLNDDGTFDASETIGGAPFYFANTIAFNIQALGTANPGAHRMRARLTFNNYANYPNMDPCSYESYGEARDYMVTIIPPPPCSNTPAPGVVSAMLATANCGAYAPQLSISGCSLQDSSGFSYQWSSSINNIAFTPIATATNSTYNGTVNSTLYYNCQVTCANGGMSATTVSELITINPTVSVVSNASACGSTTLQASGGNSFTWTPSASLNAGTGSTVFAMPTGITNYVVSNDFGCMDTVRVYASVPVIEAQFATACTSNGGTDTLYANAFLNKGLVAYYPFNGNTNDLSGNGYNATPVGVSLATDRFGNANKCYSFAGTSTYLTCPPAAYFTGGDYTISGWVNVTNVESWGRLIDFGNGPGGDNVLIALSQGTSMQLVSSNNGSNNFNSSQVLGTNTWVQVLFTYHASTQYATCYYNGVAIDSTQIVAPNNVVRNNNYIGLSNWLSYGDGGVFGSMDDIRIYSRALNFTEVGQLYNYEATAEAQTTYSWSGGSTMPYLVASSSTPSTITYTVTETRDGGACSPSGTLQLTTINCLAALNFDGNDDYVDLGSNINTNVLPGTSLITVEAWVNPSNTTSFGVIAGNYYTQSNTGMQFLLRQDGTGYTFWVDAGSGFKNIPSVTRVVTNVWQHVAGTWDGNNLSIYINGVLDNTVSGITGTFGAEANNVWLGKDNSAEYFVGSMDEVVIWSVVRTQAQIQSDLGCIHTGTGTPAGLIAYYSFDGGAANTDNAGRNTLVDGSGNGNNGTLQNFALNGTTSNWVDDANQLSALPSITSVVATNTAICVGATTTLTVNGTASTYTWSANAASATTATVSITPVNTATYVVIGANNLCKVMDSVTVNVNAVPTVSATVTNSVICDGGMTTLSGAGAVTYAWTGSVVDNTAFSPAVGVDSYTVTGTDVNGCMGKAVQTVTVNASPSVSVAVTNSSICDGGTTTLGGIGAVTYTWTGSVVDNVAFSPAVGVDSYTVSGTDANGCIGTAVQTVTVNALPSVSVTTSTVGLCVGNSATLTATGATTYTWSTTDVSPTVVVSPTNDATYTVTGTDGNGCQSMTTFTQAVNTGCGTTGIARYNNANVTVYPNPSTGVYTIELATDAQLVITNAIGEVVLTKTINAGTQNIDIQNQIGGVYFVRVIMSNNQQVIKLIKN